MVDDDCGNHLIGENLSAIFKAIMNDPNDGLFYIDGGTLLLMRANKPPGVADDDLPQEALNYRQRLNLYKPG